MVVDGRGRRPTWGEVGTRRRLRVSLIRYQMAFHIEPNSQVHWSTVYLTLVCKSCSPEESFFMIPCNGKFFEGKYLTTQTHRST